MDSARGVGIQLPRQSTLLPIAGQKQRTTMGHVFTSGSPTGSMRIWLFGLRVSDPRELRCTDLSSGFCNKRGLV